MREYHSVDCRKPENHDGHCLDAEYERFQIIVRSAGGPGKISVYVVEMDGAEWIKRKCLDQELRPKSITSRLIKAYWVIARAVYDGRTAMSAGKRARAAAAILLARLRHGEPPAKVEQWGQYKFVTRR